MQLDISYADTSINNNHLSSHAKSIIKKNIWRLDQNSLTKTIHK